MLENGADSRFIQQLLGHASAETTAIYTQLPLIQSLARDGNANPSLRLSSIAALGIYRSTADRDYLTEIAQDRR